MKLTKFAFAMAIALTGCNSSTEHLKSLNPDNFDKDIPVGDDFYGHVNHIWQQTHPLSDEYARYGNFNVLADTAEVRVRDLVLGLSATNPEPGSVAYKVSTIYEQGMDSVRRNAEGAQPIMADLRKIEETPHDGMEELFYWMQTNYSNPFVSAGPMEDLSNSDAYAMYLEPGAMTLGDRDYYLDDSERNVTVREAYKTLVNTQMQNAGYSPEEAARITANVMKIETAMAEKAWTREENRRIELMNNPRSVAELQQMYPAVNWERFFPATMDINDVDTVIVTQIEPIQRGVELLGSLSDREIKDFYLWLYVRQAAPYLSDNFSDASFEFSKVMRGVKEQRPRWKRALGTTESLLGEAIGELYVEKYFPESSKEYMVGLVENLRTALGEHIDNLTWMSDSTKANAREKLAAFTVKIGYPDKWKDYSSMTIDPALSYYENTHNASMWHQKEQLAKWGKPVDKTEWGMTPQTVNAYYNPMANEIVFPAAILQAPFFDPEASDAENYGGIGVVIGHEMTHGFDDQGRHFDANGNMREWWTEADTETFNELAQGLVKQFNEYEVLPGLYANGQLTLGENIADQGGLRVAMTAFLNAQKAKGVDVNSDAARIDGLTPIQAFYMNYANLWAQNTREEEVRSLTVSDVHSLGEARVNVTLRNLAPFFEAFDIKEGDKMFRPAEERVIIW